MNRGTKTEVTRIPAQCDRSQAVMRTESSRVPGENMWFGFVCQAQNKPTTCGVI